MIKNTLHEPTEQCVNQLAVQTASRTVFDALPPSTRLLAAGRRLAGLLQTCWLFFLSSLRYCRRLLYRSERVRIICDIFIDGRQTGHELGRTIDDWTIRGLRAAPRVCVHVTGVTVGFVEFVVLGGITLGAAITAKLVAALSAARQRFRH